MLRDAVSGASWLAAVPGADAPVELEGGSAFKLTAAASRLADLAFPRAPRLRSDLLNRAEPSVNAVAARRQLLYAMAEHGDRPNLDLTGYPPQRGLHVALLERTGLHRPDTAGSWSFAEPPDADQARLRPVWDTADDLLRAEAGSVTVASLYALWAAPPFGVRAGLLPVLAMAYVLSRRDTVAVSLDGAFAPALGTFLVDRLLQDPGAVGLRWSENEGIRHTWLSALTDALAQTGVFAQGSDAPRAPLAVARELHAYVSDLAPWALRTSRVGTLAQRLRVAVRSASDPLVLLLDQVPIMLGGTLEDAGEVQQLAGAFAGEMQALGAAYPAMLNQIAETIEREFRVGVEGGLLALQERARAVRGLTGDLRLDALAVRLDGYEGLPEQVEAVAALAAHKPVRDWTDRDVDAALLGIAELARLFLRAEAVAHVRGRTDTAEVIAIVSSNPDAGEPLVAEVRVPRAAAADAASLLAGIEGLIRRNGATEEAQLAALVRAISARVSPIGRASATAPKRKRAQ